MRRSIVNPKVEQFARCIYRAKVAGLSQIAIDCDVTQDDTIAAVAHFRSHGWYTICMDVGLVVIQWDEVSL
jgi:hypothetical protein